VAVASEAGAVFPSPKIASVIGIQLTSGGQMRISGPLGVLTNMAVRALAKASGDDCPAPKQRAKIF
jgi:hypothetical protein